MSKVLLGRRGADEPARQVLCDASELERHLSDVMLADVRQHIVVEVADGNNRLGLVRRGDADPVHRFVEVRHLDELVLDVGGSLGPVVLRDLSGRADQHVADAGLADVASAVIAGGRFDGRRRELDFAVDE